MPNLPIAASSYLFFGIATPLVVNWSYFRNELVPRLSFELGLHQIPSDATVLSVGFIAFYAYVLLPAILDFAEPSSTYKSNAVITPPNTWVVKLEQGVLALKQLFPVYAASTLLIWANTNRFDTLRSGFLVLQTISLLQLPLIHCIGCPIGRSLTNIAYRCVLAWTLLYSVMPRETTYIIAHMVQSLEYYGIHPLVVQKSSVEQEYIL